MSLSGTSRMSATFHVHSANDLAKRLGLGMLTGLSTLEFADRCALLEFEPPIGGKNAG